MTFESGPFSALLEASATAVGVGMVLGGFAAGLVGVLVGRPQDVLERQVLKTGYFFASLCLVMRWADILETI